MVKRLQAEYDEAIVDRLRGQMEVFTPQDNAARAIFVIIDHYDDAESVFSKSGAGLSGLAEVGKGKNMHLVIAGTMQITRNSSDDLRRRAEATRYTLILQDYEAVRYMGVRGVVAPNKEMPPGRGFLIKAVSAGMVQMTTPVIDGKNGRTAEEQLAEVLSDVRYRYPTRARWSYHSQDLTALDAAIRGDTPAPTATAFTPPAPESDVMASLKELMAMQASMQFSAVAEASTFASVEIPDAPKPEGENK